MQIWETIVIDSGDTAWTITATALVLLMTLPALALFYGGLVQAKNILSVLAHCFAVACLCSVLWFLCGYSLAFSGTGAWLGDTTNLLLQGITRGGARTGTKIPESVYLMFQMTFAVITPALIIGAYAERIKFSAVLMISGLWLLLVYVPVAHWVWGGGWLAARGVMDYAGGIDAHVTAGVSAPGDRRAAGRTPGVPARHSPAARPLDGDGRGFAALGRLVWLQCRQRAFGWRRCRHGAIGDASFCRHRHPGVDGD